MISHDKKAKELIDKFEEITNSTNEAAKQCALIAVDEIIKSNDLKEYPELEPHVDTMEYTSDDNWVDDVKDTFWNGVRKSLEKY